MSAVTQAPEYTVKGGGMSADASQPATSGTGQTPQGTIESMRIRSGMIGNTFGIGVRDRITERTSVTGYIQFWAWVESVNQQQTQINYADVRQGYVKLEGAWGSLMVGRSSELFVRGNTEIDILYGHGYGVGYPEAVDSNGPTQGQSGFGLLGSGFSAGVVYATPVLGGLQLTVGAFDPAQLDEAGTRTKWARPEAELTFERPIGKVGKFVLFGSGTYQRVYKTWAPDSDSVTAKGVGYGGRLELGPLRLGAAGYYGYGLGLYYAMEVSDASVDQEGQLRKSDGYYVQSMAVLGRVDVSAAWGITQIFMNADDHVVAPSTGYLLNSVIKYQQGFSCGAVYHVKPWLHLDVDLFRANFAWYLGQKQVDYIANSGMLFTW
ncbi:MAG: porin [Polyangia bacterium]